MLKIVTEESELVKHAYNIDPTAYATFTAAKVIANAAVGGDEEEKGEDKDSVDENQTLVLNPNLGIFRVLFTLVSSSKIYKKKIDYKEGDFSSKDLFLDRGDGAFVYAQGQDLFMEGPIESTSKKEPSI